MEPKNAAEWPARKRSKGFQFALLALADTFEYGNLLLTTDPTEFFMEASRQIRELKAKAAMTERMANLLIEIRSDRPTVHTEEIWFSINRLIEEYAALGGKSE